MTTGEKIRQRMKALKLTQNELARRAGMSSSGMCTIIKGTYEPRMDNLRQIAQVLGCTVPELLSDPEEESLLSQKDHQLISIVHQLNDTGYARVLSYAEDLVSSGNYEQEKNTAAG